jgi:S1-C subfamily serine protease
MQYYIRIRGKVFGPFDEDQLKTMKTKGKLSRTSEISENKVDWFPAENLEFLFPPATAPAPSQTTTSGTSASNSLPVNSGTTNAVPSEPAIWFYSVNGTEGYGPVTQTAIVQMIQTGTLRSESLVWQQGKEVLKIQASQTFARYLVKNFPTPNSDFSEYEETPKTKFLQPRLLLPIITIILIILITGTGFYLYNKITKKMDVEKVVAKVESSIAAIKGNIGSGTGFLIQPNIIVTNKHVIENEFIDLVTVTFPSAKSTTDVGPYSAKLLYADPDLDIAFLEVRAKLPILSFVKNYQFRRGQDIVAIGNPGGASDTGTIENAVSRGVLSAQVRIENIPYYQMSIAINPGNSGGPVINSSGQVIGMVTLKSWREEGHAFCIPCEEILTSLTRMTNLTDKEKKEHVVMFQAKNAVQWLALTHNILQACIKNNSRNDTVLAVIEFLFVSKNDKILSKVTSDKNLDNVIRENVADCYAACIEEYKYVRNGFPSADKHKINELKGKIDQLQTSLLLKLGVSESEINQFIDEKLNQ